MLRLCCCAGFSLVAANGDYYIVEVHRLLTVWLLLMRSTGSRARELQELQLPGCVGHRLNSCAAQA